MAFDLEAWLIAQSEQKTGSGEPLYSAETLQDFVAMVTFSGNPKLEGLSKPLEQIVGAFALRSGLNAAEPKDFKETLKKYFAARPLPPALVKSFQQQVRRDPDSKKDKVARRIRG